MSKKRTGNRARNSRASVARRAPPAESIHAPPGGFALVDLGRGQYRMTVSPELMSAAQARKYEMFELARQAELALGTASDRQRARWMLWLIGAIEAETMTGSPVDYRSPCWELLEAIRDTQAGIAVPAFQPPDRSQKHPTVKRSAEGAVANAIEARYALDRHCSRANYGRASQTVVAGVNARLNEFAAVRGLVADGLSLDTLLPGQPRKDGAGKPTGGSKLDAPTRAAGYRKAFSTSLEQVNDAKSKLTSSIALGLTEREIADLKATMAGASDNLPLLLYANCLEHLNAAPHGDARGLYLDRAYAACLEAAMRAVLRLANFSEAAPDIPNDATETSAPSP
jgi:hypothetical protein